MKSTPIPFSKVPTLSELKRGFPSVKALFFDMDGTLFDTESIHAKGMFMMEQKYQIRAPYSPQAVYELIVGKADHLVFELIKDWEGVPKHWSAQDFIDEKNANVLKLLSKIPSESYFPPSILELLITAKNEGMYVALVTSSEKVVTKQLLEIAKLDQFFHLVLTRDDCPRHKPDPWPYLKAMEISGHEKFEIIIFEDSHVGLEAATTSGAHVIKVEWYESRP
jgi:HAD superfamily hydrolase (TIGR01509 family)